MNAVTDFLLRVGPIAVGGGVVQFVIYLLKRRVEMRGLDAAAAKAEAESGNVIVTSAEKSLALSDLVRDQAVKRAEMLLADLDVQHERVKRLTERLALAEREVHTLNGEVAALHREGSALRAEVARLREIWPPPPGLGVTAP